MDHPITDLLLTSVQYTGYISIPKFILFLVSFYLWLWLVTWVYHDAVQVETKVVLWTAVVFGAGAVAAFIWLLIPIFIVGIMLYLTATAAAAISYVTHRNAMVMDYDRILTAEHIKGLFASKEKKLEAMKNLVFITANNNEIPVPAPKTPEFFGYKAAYELFTDAAWRRASDILFSPTHQDYNVIYQIDGAALKQPSIPRDQMEFFVRFIKNLGDLEIDEKRKPQKGNFRIHRGEQDTEWEVATAGSTAGEQIRLRQMMQQSITQLTEIGLMPEQYEQLNRISKLKEGLFIVSGPPKTGVTTTFYSLLQNHDAFINNINTLERQPAAELPNITQNVFTLSDTGTTTYAKKLQAIVRMGPDIVGVADCRDTETAQVVCKAAKDVKIVYLTLEADGVMDALDKWIKLVGDVNQAVQSLLGISNQRLLRKVCDECKQAYAPNKELLRKFSIPPEKAKVLYRAGKVQYDKHGKPVTCENCQGTGFVGRTGVFETIALDSDLRKAIRQSPSISEIASQFRRAKMLYLQEQALRKVVAGTTSINEMVRVLAKSRKAEKPEEK